VASAVDGPPANTAQIRVRLFRPCGNCRLRAKTLHCAHKSWPAPPHRLRPLVGSWSSGATAAKDDWRPARQPAPSAINQALRQLCDSSRCQAETKLAFLPPISGGFEAMQLRVPTPPRRLRSTRPPWPPGSGTWKLSGAGSKAAARNHPDKELPPSPFHRPSPRHPTPPAKPSNALELEHLPRHDRGPR